MGTQPLLGGARTCGIQTHPNTHTQTQANKHLDVRLQNHHQQHQQQQHGAGRGWGCKATDARGRRTMEGRRGRCDCTWQKVRMMGTVRSNRGRVVNSHSDGDEVRGTKQTNAPVPCELRTRGLESNLSSIRTRGRPSCSTPCNASTRACCDQVRNLFVQDSPALVRITQSISNERH